MKENSIEDIEILETWLEELNELFNKTHINNTKERNALYNILSDYKKLQEEFKQVDHECERLEEKEVRLIKENEELKSNSNDSVVAIKLYSLQKENEQLRTEVNSLKEENEELKADNYELDNRITDLLENIPKSKLKDIIDRIDYDIKKTKEIISKNTNIYASYRKNDYQIVRLRAMNTKSLDIKKRLQELLESEE